MVSLLLGLLVLITHLGKPEAAFYTMLTPNLGSVMTWGVFFNVFALLFGGLFALPGLIKLPYAANEKIMKILGTLGSIFSFLVITYTGTLLARSSIHSWRSPATPLLFLLVALSSGVGLYALVAYILKKEVPGELVNSSMKTTLLAFVTMTLYFALANISTEAFRFSVELMLTEYMWATLLLYLLGFIGPFAVYFYNKKKPSKTNLLILAVLFILQSFLARYLLVYAGAMELPW